MGIRVISLEVASPTIKRFSDRAHMCSVNGSNMYVLLAKRRSKYDVWVSYDVETRKLKKMFRLMSPYSYCHSYSSVVYHHGVLTYSQKLINAKFKVKEAV